MSGDPQQGEDIVSAQITTTEDGCRLIPLEPVSISADKQGRRQGHLDTERFLRHAGVASRATIPLLRFGCYVAVNGDKKMKRVVPGDTVTVHIGSDSLLRLLKLPATAAAVAEADDVLVIPATD